MSWSRESFPVYSPYFDPSFKLGTSEGGTGDGGLPEASTKESPPSPAGYSQAKQGRRKRKLNLFNLSVFFPSFSRTLSLFLLSLFFLTQIQLPNSRSPPAGTVPKAAELTPCSNTFSGSCTTTVSASLVQEASCLPFLDLCFLPLINGVHLSPCVPSTPATQYLSFPQPHTPLYCLSNFLLDS